MRRDLWTRDARVGGRQRTTLHRSNLDTICRSLSLHHQSLVQPMQAACALCVIVKQTGPCGVCLSTGGGLCSLPSGGLVDGRRTRSIIVLASAHSAQHTAAHPWKCPWVAHVLLCAHRMHSPSTSLLGCLCPPPRSRIAHLGAPCQRRDPLHRTHTLTITCCRQQ